MKYSSNLNTLKLVEFRNGTHIDDLKKIIELVTKEQNTKILVMMLVVQYLNIC